MLPSLGSFIIVDAITGGSLVRVNMRETGTLFLENPALTQLQVVFSSLVEHTYQLEPGWHMISLPLAVQDASLPSIFPGAISLFGFDNGYYTADELQPLVGYWVNMAEASQVTIQGASHSECNAEVPGGWSMVGPCENTVNVAGLNPDLVSAFGFGGGYFVAEAMEPGRGYWTNMANSGNSICAVEG